LAYIVVVKIFPALDSHGAYTAAAMEIFPVLDLRAAYIVVAAENITPQRPQYQLS
jgi:hypothetical protein